MAFSTQKDFFYVPFMNESVEFECRKACVKLKSYDSSIDDRSWAMDDTLQSRFLSDLVTCNTPSFLSKGIVGADSVIQCANKHLSRLEEVLVQKKNLEKQLEVSNERLKTANLENEKIKSIMNEKYDSSHSKNFYNKIQQLASANKISKNEETELLNIYNKVEDMNRAHEILQAENAYLKRLLEKLSLRATIDSIKVEPETSTDITYLQNQVNSLRKEVSLLRKMEDEKLRSQMDNRNSISDQDAQNLKAIIKERNTLRDKCKTFDKLEKKVLELQKKAKDADHMSGSLTSNLDNQTKYIGDMEKEMHRMQNYYEEQLNKTKFNEELLKCQLEEMKEALVRAKCEAQKVDCLQMEVGCLRNELMRRDVALSDYDCQYKQLMSVIEELQGNLIQNLQDTETQTCGDYFDDLAFFASATLSEIQKEMDKRKFSIPTGDTMLSPEECCAEVERLQKVVKQTLADKEKLEKDMRKMAEDMCADVIAKLKHMEDKYGKAILDVEAVRSENKRLSQQALSKLDNLSNRLADLGNDIDRNTNETAGISKDLQESIRLAKDISDVQLQNQELANAVNALNSRDDEKLIDALRRQLQEEQNKNKRCVEQNDQLRKEMEKRGITLPPPVDLTSTAGAAGGPSGGPAGVPAGVAGGNGGAADGSAGITGIPGEAVGGPGVVAGGPDGVAGGPAAGGPGVTVGGPDGVAGSPGGVVGGPGGIESSPYGDVAGPGGVAGVPDGVAGGVAEGPSGTAGGPGGVAGGTAGVVAEGPGEAAGGPGGTAGGPGGVADGPGGAAGVADGPAGTAGVPGGTTDRPDGAAGGRGGVVGGPDGTAEGTGGAAAGGPDGAVPGGPTETTGGPAETTAGSAGTTGGPAGTTGAPAGTTGGPDGVAGGPRGTTGGPGGAAGGPRGTTGGLGGAAGGPRGTTGGPGGAAGGPRGTTGGPIGAAGGPRGTTGGPGGAAGGPRGTTGGPGGAAGGPRGTTGGPGGAAAGPGRAAAGPGGAAAGPGGAAAGPGGAAAGPGGAAAGPGGAAAGPGGAAAGPGGAVAGPGGAAGGPDGAAGAAGGPGGTAGGPGGVAGGPDGAAGTTGGPDEVADGTRGTTGGPGGTAGGPRGTTGGSRGTTGGPGGAAGGPLGTTGGPGAVAGGPGGVAGGPGGVAGGPGGVAGGPGGIAGGVAGTVGGAQSSGGRPGGATDGVAAKGIGSGRGDKSKDGTGQDPFQSFVISNASNMMMNLSAGSNLEKELRAILNAFMQECGFCFCKSNLPKSKFYALCHKILHHGIQNMLYKELVYMHRKIFMAAEKLHPGCLLDMVLTEQGLKIGDMFKCCNCRNVLCCSNSEEMLKEKVCKLERDIELAKEYLDKMKVRPQTPYSSSRKTYRLDAGEEHEKMMQNAYPQMKPPPRCSNKQIKTLKARILKCSDLMK